MKFYIMTLFPDMVLQGLNTSIIGRAMAKGILSIEAVNIRDYAFNKHNSVDDYPYGGCLLYTSHHDRCKGIPFFSGSLRGCGFNQLQLDRVNSFHCRMIHPFVHIPQILS